MSNYLIDKQVAASTARMGCTYIYRKGGNDNIVTCEPTEEANEHFYFLSTHPVATADHFIQEGGREKKQGDKIKHHIENASKPFSLSSEVETL